MLWSKVKTAFIIGFLLLDIAFLVLLGLTSAESGLSADEVSEIITLCEHYGITLTAEKLPTQTTRLPMLEARFMTVEDLPEESRAAFVFDGEGAFVYQGKNPSKTPPKDEKSARKLVADTLKSWGFDSTSYRIEVTGAITARAQFVYQNHAAFDCAITFVLSDNEVVSAKGRWPWAVTVTQGAQTLLDAPTVLAELVEEDALCHRGLAVDAVEVGYFPESTGGGVVHKIFPISPAYRIALSDGTERIYFAFE